MAEKTKDELDKPMGSVSLKDTTGGTKATETKTSDKPAAATSAGEAGKEGEKKSYFTPLNIGIGLGVIALGYFAYTKFLKKKK